MLEGEIEDRFSGIEIVNNRGDYTGPDSLWRNYWWEIESIINLVLIPTNNYKKKILTKELKLNIKLWTTVNKIKIVKKLDVIRITISYNNGM